MKLISPEPHSPIPTKIKKIPSSRNSRKDKASPIPEKSKCLPRKLQAIQKNYNISQQSNIPQKKPIPNLPKPQIQEVKNMLNYLEVI